jgi:hypothetical protein
MRQRTVLLACLLAAGWLTYGCGSKTDTITTPTPVGSSGAVGSSEQPPNLPTPSPPTSPAGSGSCDASKAQWTVGQRASDQLLERARVAAGATTARFIGPNQPITMEYFGWRLNLWLNHQGLVRSVNCG